MNTRKIFQCLLLLAYMASCISQVPNNDAKSSKNNLQTRYDTVGKEQQCPFFQKKLVFNKKKDFCKKHHIKKNVFTNPKLSNESNESNLQIARRITFIRFKLLSVIKNVYRKKIAYNVKGTIGAAALHETLWMLGLIKNDTIKKGKNIKKLLNTILKLLKNLKAIKYKNKFNDIWGIDLVDVDFKTLGIAHNNNVSLNKKEIYCKEFCASIKKNLSKGNGAILKEIYRTYLEIDKIKSKNPSCPTKLNKLRLSAKANIALLLIFKRGILAPDPLWWKINEKLLQDKSGVKTYFEAKDAYKAPIASSRFLGIGKNIHVVIDNNFVKQILNQSPNLFGPEHVKKKVFKTFMNNSLGISTGKSRYNRRKMNDEVLCFPKLHKYAHTHNSYIKELIQNQKKWNCLPKNTADFYRIGKKIVSKVVFNDYKGIPDSVFEMFRCANSISSLLDKNYAIPSSIKVPVTEYFNKNINNPQPKSLIKSASKTDKLKHCPQSGKFGLEYKKDEIRGQISHWIFPLMKLFFATTPRILLLLCNHPKHFTKIIKEIKQLNDNDPKQIYNARYLRNCILEMLRLNSTVMATLRILKKPYSFDLKGKYSFKAGEKFLILNNSVMRDPEKFRNPNQFCPDRWDRDLEKSYYSIMFGQGPQRCPGKELGIFLIQSLLVHYLKAANFKISSNKINTNNIEQMINYFKIKLRIKG